MQAFKDAKDAFAEVSENASAKTEEQEAEKEQQKAAKIVEDDKAKRKADTLARLRSNRPQRDLHRPSKNEIARRNRGLQNKKHIE